MAIPDYQTLMLPLLRYVGQHETVRIDEAVEALSHEFRLTDTEREALLPSGKQAIMTNRIGWARTYLKKARLLDSPARGAAQITKRGREVLANPPEKITVQFLEQFPEFIEFREARQHVEEGNPAKVFFRPSAQTPEEQFEDSYQELREDLVDRLLEKVMSCSPVFFERLVVETLVKMGYGGSRAEAGRAIGRSGDEGIDGIISEDRLGLDMIYIQAKRWKGVVGRPEIQKFAGALQGKKAQKGIFITTSEFTGEARSYAQSIDTRIVLLSGRQFAELMLEHAVGVTTTATYRLSKIDLDFFLEDGQQ